MNKQTNKRTVQKQKTKYKRKEKHRNNDPAWKFGENAASAKVGRRL